jgi:hypothetical protein
LLKIIDCLISTCSTFPCLAIFEALGLIFRV